MNSKDIREKMIHNEILLSKYATKDKDAIRLVDEDLSDEMRGNFGHDSDRILYSLSYTRYIDKTQVFSSRGNDHITKRMIHVQFVSKIARTISRALGLNEDLAEAIALGHDIGHVPFGHLGEKYLNEISLRFNEGYFMHNVESVRELMLLEDDGKGKNLCIQTLDGMLCHNGEFLQANYKPRPKTKEEFLHDYEECYRSKEHASSLVPMTMEGCVVRISDIIGYLGRDIDDAIRLGVLNKEEIPDSIKNILGNENSDIIDAIIKDIVNNSFGKDCITMSPEIYEAVKELKDFNYKHIYDKANTPEEKEHIKEMFNTVADSVLAQIKTNDTDARIFRTFLKDMEPKYLEETTPERKVIDYIAGMTDYYFTQEYEEVKKLIRK